ncbi:MAG: Trk family potassium uptake protein [Limosilactobacillus sp.]|nr:Trk family potassium uptake protein [Limosilactobacillus sp.]
MIEINHRKYSVPKVLTAGFIFVILIGMLLLKLPIATRAGLETSWMTALFTSTSATCVTGLLLVDTATHWTWFGQLVIALLVEIGGLGFMTFVVMGFIITKRQMRISTQLLTQEALNLDHLSQSRVVYLIIRLSLLIQGAGAALLAVDLVPKYGWRHGLWLSVFQSISAFCNAGFDLFGNSLENFKNDPYFLLITAGLIIAGSFGFLVWQDILEYHKRHRMTLHTKLALRTGAGLMLISLIVYFILERNLATFSAEMSPLNRIVNTIFMAITPRTAGLTTIPYQDLSAASIAVTAIMMFIGGAPGSTAGGVKTTTVGLIALQSIATLRGKSDTVLANRRFTQDNIFRALTLLFLSFMLILLAVLILVATQALPEKDPLSYVIFETVAAFGTTGISLGITSTLNFVGQVVIMILMFIGRVGIYTVMFSIFNAQPAKQTYHYPEESVLIG